MDGYAISRVNALFSVGRQDTGLVIREADDGTYEVNALFRNVGDTGFPAREIVERDGRVYQVDVDGLASTLLAVCRHGWFHHYLAHTTLFKPYGESRWSLMIQYANGTSRRWEGVNDAPSTLGGVYDLLVSFGMPPLRIEEQQLLPSFRSLSVSEFSFSRIAQYRALLAEAQSLEREGEPSEDFRLLADEFFDDVRRYLEDAFEEVAPPVASSVWGIRPILEELEMTDVRRASKGKMLALFDALTQAGSSLEVVSRILQTGMLDRWCARMEEIPLEESREKARERKEQHDRLVASVDDAIRKRIAGKKVFTAYDVAEDAQTSAQQASMRIRSFVRSGTVQTVGSDYPRKYKAA